ncbi:MAG: hypothetical protein WCF06_02760 [Nitrososphaeraceae archaeon]
MEFYIDNLLKVLPQYHWMNESFFFFNPLVRKVLWIEQSSKPVVTVTNSHRNFCMFDAINLEGKQMFRKYDRQI